MMNPSYTIQSGRLHPYIQSIVPVISLQQCHHRHHRHHRQCYSDCWMLDYCMPGASSHSSTHHLLMTLTHTYRMLPHLLTPSNTP